MGYELDAGLQEYMGPLLEKLAEAKPPDTGDIAARRAGFEPLLKSIMTQLPSDPGVTTSDHSTTGHDGETVPLRLYRPPGEGTGGLIVYIHGGGMILGSIDLWDPLVRMLVTESGAALLAVEYRLAPEHPHPTPVEDCYAGLKWAAENAAELGFDPARIGIAGDSGGGGLAASLGLVARDRGGPAVAKQVLVYPMLDDRVTVPGDPPLPYQLWTYGDNETGWKALLGEKGDDGTGHGAPARAASLAGLPPTFINVGDLDIFRDEDIEYAGRLAAAGVPIELHVYPGAPHGFDFLGYPSEISKTSYADEARAMSTV